MDDEIVFASEIEEPSSLIPPPQPRQWWPTLFLLLVAALSFWALIGYFHRYTIVSAAGSIADIGFGSSDIAQTYYPFPWQQKQRKALEFALNGNIQANTLKEQYAPFLEKHPGDRAYYAFYVLSVYSGQDYSPEVEAACRKGEKLDPNNALYNYLLAKAMLRKAVEQHTGKDKQIIRTIVDRPLLDRAMLEFQRGAKKPIVHGYHLEIVQAQCAAMPTSRNWEDQLHLIAVRASANMPELAGLREFTRTTPWYANLLINEGKRADALAVLSSWEPMEKQTIVESHTLIHILVAIAMAKIAGDSFPPVYERLGDSELATAFHRRAEQTYQLMAVFRKYKTEEGRRYDDLLIRNAGDVPFNLLPMFGPVAAVTAKELAPTRRVEYVLIEELIVSFVILVLLVLTAYFSLVAFRWWMLVRKDRQVIRVISLPFAQWLRIFGFGMGLPVILYAILSRFTTLGGWQTGYQNHSPLYSVSWYLPALIIIIALPLYLARRAFRRLCIAEGMEMPSRGKETFMRFCGTVSATIISLAGASLLGSFLLWTIFPRLMESIELSTASDISADILSRSNALLVSGGSLLFLLLIFLLPVLWERVYKHYGRYLGSLARSLAMACGVSLLIVIGILAPLLNMEERALVRHDPLLFYQSGQRITSITPVEARVIGHVRTRMMDIYSITER